MTPIFALFLKTTFEEGEDFLLYNYVSSKFKAERGDIDWEKLCAPGLRGLYWSCDQVMLELAGEHAKSVRVTVPLTSGGTTHVCIGSVVLKHAKFIVAFHGRLEANLVQTATRTLLDVVMFLRGPVSEGLHGYGVTPEQLREELDPVFAYLFNLFTSSPLRVSCGMSTFPEFPIPAPIKCELAAVLSSLETGAVGALQRSSDDISLCFPVGSGIMKGGRLLKGHNLVSVDSVAYCHAIGFAVGLSPSSKSEARAVSMNVHIPVRKTTGCAQRPSDDSCDGVVWQKRIVAVTTLGDTLLFVVLRQRLPVTCELDPFWLESLKPALFNLHMSGLLDTIQQWLELGAISSRLPGSISAYTPDNPQSSQLITAGAVNALVSLVTFDVVKCCLLEVPVPACVSHGGISEGTHQLMKVQDQIRQTVFTLREILRGMRQLKPPVAGETSSTPTRPSLSADRGVDGLPSAIFSPPSKLRAQLIAKSESGGKGMGSVTSTASVATSGSDSQPSLVFTPELSRVLFGSLFPAAVATDPSADPDVFDDMSSVSSDDDSDRAFRSIQGRSTFATPSRQTSSTARTALELGKADSSPFRRSDRSGEVAGSLHKAVEAGMKLEIPPLKLWVSGRILDNGKEMYVCHDAEVPQDVVEIAFRMTL